VKTAVIGIGSNLGDRLDYINRAVNALAHLPGTRVAGCSRVYETEPYGYADQPKFLNAAARIETDLSPLTLLGGCLGIEAALGRVRTFANAPRTIDLDVLLYEGEPVDVRELKVPHPGILERAFVMVPLLDLFPSGVALGFPFAGRLSELSRDGIARQDVGIALPPATTFRA
jgi:2-amino-4-hydroxy-6-hydroxymethyldihydropteridine diphosphokinase